MMNLIQAMRISKKIQAAFVGSGGKTTALFQLARLLPPPVVVTASTHLGEWQAKLADVRLVSSRPEDMERFAGQIEGVTLISGPGGQDDRLGGLDTPSLEALNDLSDRLGFSVLVEADGSRQLPLKAPASYEPLIPAWVDTVVVVAGLSGLGKVLDGNSVHRPERFGELGGLAIGDLVSEEALARVLSHPEGGLKGIPGAARKILLLNQADSNEYAEAGLRIANMVNGMYDSVLVTALENRFVWQVVEPAAGVILAAGESSRFGQPKMLLPWRGRPLIRHAAEAALAGGLNPVVVVLGAEDGAIRGALEGLPVQFVPNADWQQGQSASIRQGIAALPEKTGSALFLLADQPLVTSGLIRALVERHQAALAPVIAPRVEGQRANPVLFDRSVFAQLEELRGDTGGRALLGKLDWEFLDWPDTNLLLDIDTPEDYERLRQME